ncbi:MAG: coenzyme F420-0:L-glutamate ligase, partial [Chloroflexota bacterium]|nr:coenzyme F420-0:L-glutamate ligase [Chloroflexota bacterium]
MTTSPRTGGDAEVRVIGLRNIPMVEEGDDLAVLTFGAALAQGAGIRNGDVLVVAQRIVSKAEGRVVPLDRFEPSPFARSWAEQWDKDPRQV